MAITLVDVGTTANDGTGDPLRTAFQTVNTALTLVDNAVVVGVGTTTFKDDSGTYGVAVASNGDVSFVKAGGTVGMTWDVSANSNAGGMGFGTPTPARPLEISTSTETSILRLTDTATIGTAGRVVGGMEFYQNDASGGAGVGSSIYSEHLDSSGNTDLRFSTGDNTLACRINGNGDFIWQNAGASVGMTWDNSALTNTGALGINEVAPDYKLDVNGTFGFTPGASVTPVDIGDVVFQATSNTTFTVKFKGSDGVVRSGTIALS